VSRDKLSNTISIKFVIWLCEGKIGKSKALDWASADYCD